MNHMEKKQGTLQKSVIALQGIKSLTSTDPDGKIIVYSPVSNIHGDDPFIISDTFRKWHVGIALGRGLGEHII